MIFLRRYIGIILSALYGIVMRLIYEPLLHADEIYSLFSITFIWILPVVLGSIPILLATDEARNSLKTAIISPAVSVMFFAFITLATGIEDLLCIIIISIPFLVSAVAGGLLVHWLTKVIRKKRTMTIIFMMSPFIGTSIESRFTTETNTYNVRTSVIIDSPADRIWQHIIRVETITDQEYSKGFFNHIGMPKPLSAELKNDAVGEIRTGHFEGGLTFTERITRCQRNKLISFSIAVDSLSTQTTAFQKHVLTGGNFRFIEASYELKPLDSDHTELTLVSSYRLNMNTANYASLWGNMMLSDFQERLLSVIKKRCDNKLSQRPF